MINIKGFLVVFDGNGCTLVVPTIYPENKFNAVLKSSIT